MSSEWKNLYFKYLVNQYLIYFEVFFHFKVHNIFPMFETLLKKKLFVFVSSFIEWNRQIFLNKDNAFYKREKPIGCIQQDFPFIWFICNTILFFTIKNKTHLHFCLKFKVTVNLIQNLKSYCIIKLETKFYHEIYITEIKIIYLFLGESGAGIHKGECLITHDVIASFH